MMGGENGKFGCSFFQAGGEQGICKNKYGFTRGIYLEKES